MSKHAAESERLWLEPLSVDKHLDDYHELMSASWGVLYQTKSQSKEFLLSRTPHPEKPWIENYAILLRPLSPLVEDEKPKLIGAIGMIRFEAGHGAEVGYGIHPDYQGKGIATEALRLFVELYFSREREGDWNTLVAAIDPENTASERVVEKSGFRKGDLQDDEDDISAGKTKQYREWLLAKPS